MAIKAIFSDIHSNLTAFQAALDDMDKRGVTEWISLGDTIGYGPQPVECLRLARERCQVLLRGNHEHAVIEGPIGFNPYAARAIHWTRQKIEKAGELDYVASLNPACLNGRELYVHGSVNDPLMEYVREGNSPERFEYMIETIEQEFQHFDLCFNGHNHRPFLGTMEGTINPHEGHSRFYVKGEKLYISVGSIGQPRDGDPRACYCIYDGEWVEFIRVPYDNQKVADEILEAGLPEFLADRLLTGD